MIKMSMNVLNFKYIQIEMLNMKLFCNGYVAEPEELTTLYKCCFEMYLGYTFDVCY